MVSIKRDRKTVALIVAAGRGERFGALQPKQYCSLAGQPVLRRTVTAFLDHPGIDAVQVVIRPDHAELYENAVAGLPLPAPLFGGATRQETVANSLDALKTQGFETVLVHDGARPMVSARIITDVLRALADGADGVIPALPVTDTLKRADADGLIETSVDRAGLWRAQTPQGFDLEKLCAAYARCDALAGLTDDASVFEAAGLPVQIVPGGADNLKITTQDDMIAAETLLYARAADTRTGTGYDVHRLVEKSDDTHRLMLCGVEVEHTHYLEGHSDADVGLHAITDAILGAIGDGDIGRHFSPKDPRWKGADSAAFLEHAVSLAHALGGFVSHVDLTLICEAPKIGPRRENMRRRIAEIIGIDITRVSLKATTTEGLGFTGRREGIAAQALATVRLPLGAGARKTDMPQTGTTEGEKWAA